jgi:hypothetical protein
LQRQTKRYLSSGSWPTKEHRYEQRRCRGRIAQSTLRRTLTALLMKAHNFRVFFTPSGKPKMSPKDEAKLSLWMNAHARVTWLVTIG